MRFSLFDWLLLGFAALAGIALLVVQAYVSAVVVVALMVIAVFLHRSVNDRPGRFS